MKLSKSLTLLLGTAAMFAMYGCGSDNRESNIDQQTATLQASAACISCHATNKTSPVTGALIVEEWKKSVHNTKSGAACTDCHTNSGHPNGGSIVKAVEDTKCATCHSVASLGAPHFSPFNNLTSAQYISAFDAAGVQCRKCHNPHDTTSLIQYNKDWAESGHGNVAFSNDGNSDNNSVNSHYGWTVAARDACSKCHTTSGYLNFLADGTAPFLSSKTKNEAIMCSACHADYGWARRAAGVQTLEYTYDSDLVPGGGGDAFAGAAPATVNGPTAPAAIVLPNVGDSNLCLVCHGGRGNFQSARAARFEGHHAPTGADVFAQYTHFGYEFAGLNYTKPVNYIHDSIGVATGSGPCVSCHMKSTKSHTFDVVTKNASGVITAITTQAVCNTCHTGASAINAATLEEQSLGYQNAGKLVIDYLANTVPNYTGAPIVITTTAQANAAHVNTYGAFQNSLLTSEDPGGYAHNIYYVKRLLFDSIDWLDNHAFDGTITVPAGYPAARTWFGADATTGVATRP